jgi:hypothetical protein
VLAHELSNCHSATSYKIPVGDREYSVPNTDDALRALVLRELGIMITCRNTQEVA